MKDLFLGCFGLLLVLFVIFGIIGVRIVNPGEAAVVTRFGSLQGVRAEGLYIEPLTAFTYYDTKVIALSSNETAATKDLQDVVIAIVVNMKYGKEDLEFIYNNFGSVEDIQNRIVKPALSEEVKAITTEYNAENLLVNRIQVRDQVLAGLREGLSEYPFDIVDLSIVNIAFSSVEFNQAIERKQVAEQRALQAKFELEQAKLDAEKQKTLDATLTQQILQQQFIDKWNGALPQYVGDGDFLNLLLNK
jgi:regulator of protease activity HflC (stomatin/prohibitin superfamily)